MRNIKFNYDEPKSRRVVSLDCSHPKAVMRTCPIPKSDSWQKIEQISNTSYLFYGVVQSAKHIA